MKYLIFIFIAFCFCSCKLPNFAKVESEKPWVALKKGDKINTDAVEVQSAKGGMQIIAGNNFYPAKNVAAYSNGIGTYVNLKDTVFAKKVVAGKLSLYTTALNSYGLPVSSKPFFYYAAKNESYDLKQLSYPSLSKLIPSKSDSRKYLDRYNTVNKATLIFGTLALATTAIGLFDILQEKDGKTGLIKNPKGVTISVTGIWCFIAMALINEQNKVNLFKAVKEYNNSGL